MGICILTSHILLQIDEPLMVRFPEKALSYGIDDLAKCFVGVLDDTTKVVHLCCGYPLYLVSL
jgi:5-methyltetrahydropteroyltriglutamate--homocysteine methyltransferase